MKPHPEMIEGSESRERFHTAVTSPGQTRNDQPDTVRPSQACKVCLLQHDEEIHGATYRVHGWFRAEVTKHLHDAADEPVLGEREELAAPQLNDA